jgi:hypothetical protein
MASWLAQLEMKEMLVEFRHGNNFVAILTSKCGGRKNCISNICARRDMSLFQFFHLGMTGTGNGKDAKGNV